MNAFSKFWSLGAEDADRRVASALAPAPIEPADRYLRTSVVVIAFDRATLRLSEWWRGSEAAKASSAILERFMDDAPAVRDRSIGVVLLTAVIVHVMLTLLQGPRPGFFWMVIPGLVALFAVLLLAGSRSPGSTD